MKLKLQSLITAFFFIITIVVSAQTKVWKKSKINGTLNGISINSLDKKNYNTVALDFNSFKKELKNISLRGVTAKNSTSIINLPNEKGGIQSFNMYEAPVFSPSLAAKYPNIKSYIGYSSDGSGAIVRMSVSPKGVQTMISYVNKPMVFMQPVDGNVNTYIVYNKQSKMGIEADAFICSTIDKVKNDANSSITNRASNDQTLRKFRIAVSVNGEYTSFHGGTVADALAAINATLTRVNQVFETDMAITFELVDATQLIYTDAATDPYSGTLSNWNVELQNTLTNTIGNAAYDIGHMFGASGGGGNAGCIGCVCVDDTVSTTDLNKGAGITSPADGIPQGDTFDIDYVAHEIGHQMGANHTFSHSNEGYGVNTEPGSGSTIMGYAGIVSGSNVQQHSDPYFHYNSIKQISDNMAIRTCWQANNPVNLTNNAPVANAGADYTIPKGTAYVLRGSATDTDAGDTLEYCWEQIDDGGGTTTGSSFGPTRTTGPQVRSLNPTTSSDRYIPKMSRIVSGNLTQTNPASGSAWETVSTVARSLNFALTVRDRQPTATGLNGQSHSDLMKITVDANSGPFAVTAPATAVTWDTGTSQTITWDVANTTAAPVNTQNVHIKLSKDGGITYPITLASNVANNGSYTFTVPDEATTMARVMVEAAGNIFLAVNSTDFTINSTTPTFIVTNTSGDQAVCNSGGNTASYNLDFSFINGFTETVTLSSTGQPAGSTVTFNPTSINANGTVTMTISNLDGAIVQPNTINVVGTATSIAQNIDVILNVQSSTFQNVTLSEPADAAVDIVLTPVLKWQADSNVASYDVEVATDSGFTNIVASSNVVTNQYTVSPTLNQTTQYYWRVKPKNNCGTGTFSTAFSFTTQSCSLCASSGNTTFQTSTTLVQFNTINNSSAKPSGYSDYTAMTTNVKRGDAHDLTVNVNTDGTYRVQTKVWIDWNHNCSFDDTGEEYDLAEASNTANGPTANSPLSITIPNDAILGNTIMRVSTKYTDPTTVVFPSSCETSFDGEVEDYTLIVEAATASIEDFAFNGFNLYPNPSKGVFNLKLEVVNTDKVSVKLFDIRGRLISEKNFFNVSENFSEKLIFNKVAKGLYLLRIINGGKQTTRKVMIE